MMRTPMVENWKRATDGYWYGEGHSTWFRRLPDGEGWAYEVATWPAALRGDVPWDMPAPDPVTHPDEYTWQPWPVDARAREAARAAYWLTD